MNEMNLNYQEIKNNIRTRFQNMQTDYVAIGYYLRQVLNNELYLEDGYKNIHEFAQAEFGMKKANVNHCVRINMEFSVGGDSPELDDKYHGFSKSQLQELLYIPEDRRDEVTPDMTVREIRELKEERLDVEPEPEPEPVSILGYPLRVYPEGSLLSTPGCGNQDCFSCHRDGCELRQEECYCVEAPMGNPFPCTTLNIVENIRQDIGNQCQFVNEDLAYHRAGDGQPVPCCKQCNNPCGYECRRSVDKRHADMQPKESDKTKPENQEKSSCPPDVHSCIRQEWGTSPEQQHKGAKECAKCWSEWKKRQEVVGTADKTVAEKEAENITPSEPEARDEAWFVKTYMEEYAGNDELKEFMRICREYKNNGDRAKMIQEYKAPYGCSYRGCLDFGCRFNGFSGGIDFDADNYTQRIHMEYGRFVEELLKLYDPFSPEFASDQPDSVIEPADSVIKPDDSVIDADYHEVEDTAENTENPEICCEDSSGPEDVTYSEKAIRDYLHEEEKTLEEYERVNRVEKLPQNPMMRQRMLVKALKLLLESEKEVEEPEEDDEPEDGFLNGKEFMTCARNSLSNLNVEIGHKAWKAALSSSEHLVHYLRLVMNKNTDQPELPVMKNNDQRKEFLDSFHDWPVWFEVLETSEVYYRYNMPDGNSIVICEYNSYCEWMAQYNDMDPEKKYQKMYLLEPGYRYLYDCLKNKSQLVDYLKEAQKK